MLAQREANGAFQITQLSPWSLGRAVGPCPPEPEVLARERFSQSNLSISQALRAPNQLTTAVGAFEVHLVGTWGAEGALIGANIGFAFMSYFLLTPLAALFHFQHVAGSFAQLMLAEARLEAWDRGLETSGTDGISRRVLGLGPRESERRGVSQRGKRKRFGTSSSVGSSW